MGDGFPFALRDRLRICGSIALVLVLLLNRPLHAQEDDGSKSILSLSPLRAGDIILSINDRQINNLTDFHKVEGNLGNVGDTIRVKIRRDRNEHSLEYSLPPSRSNGYKYVSTRWWKFPKVAGTDIDLAPLQCGCPLIDKEGRVVGIYIACRSEYFGWGLRYVLPAQIVTQFVEKAKAQAGD